MKVLIVGLRVLVMIGDLLVAVTLVVVASAGGAWTVGAALFGYLFAQELRRMGWPAWKY